MPIKFDRENKIFTLTTKNTKYVFGIRDERYLVHQFYGKKTAKFEPFNPRFLSFSPYHGRDGYMWSPDVFREEFSFFGSGDFRATSLKVRGADGSCVTDFVYKSYKKFRGKADPDGLPAARADESTETLAVELYDSISSCVLTLYYTVYYDVDIIIRRMSLENRGDTTVKIEKCMSLALDLPRCDYDMVSLYGIHCGERNYQRAPLHHGVQSVFSRRGASSHQFNPFIALCSKKAGEERGEVYGFNFIWSGSFLDEVEVDQLGHTRVQVGLGEENFGYTLAAGESLDAPEAVMTYSADGFGKMTRNFHDFTRRYILPESSVKRAHPVVLNTWEACFFDIDEEKLIEFAKESAKIGIDMLVMDDGWFGKRNSDNAGLGDWFPNKEKFRHGLGSFVEKVKACGVSFGIWIEPEMVNPDSDLYRAHPDWALSSPGRDPALSRDQLILDMSRRDVIEYLKDTFKKTFGGVPIDYFKWDANRHLSDVYSHALPPERQDEVAFRNMKGTYELLRWFGEEFPDAVIETCAGGGGRYDLGMMRYGFQIWTSDNTHPYSRLWIQRSSLLAYPAATMSCHVSNPRGDVRSLDFRYKVAVGGMLGYELNIIDMKDEIKDEMKRQIKDYRSFEHVVREGDYFNLVSPFLDDYSAYYYAAKDRTELLISMIEKERSTPRKTKPLKIKEAKKDANYVDRLSGKKYSGASLRAGLTFELIGEQDTAVIMYLTEAK